MRDVDPALGGHADMTYPVGPAQLPHSVTLLQVGRCAHVLYHLGTLAYAVHLHALKPHQSIGDPLSPSPDAHTGTERAGMVGQGLVSTSIPHRKPQIIVHPLVGDHLAPDLAHHLPRPVEHRVRVLRLNPQPQDQVLFLRLPRHGHPSGVGPPVRQGVQHLHQVLPDGSWPSPSPGLMQYPADSTHGNSTFRSECKNGRPRLGRLVV